MSGYTIGIDIGTTGLKVLLLDTEGTIVAQTSRESTLHSPRPGFAEADPLQWEESVFESIREVIRASGINPTDVAGLATSGMVPAVIPIDKFGKPLRRAILQNDARAAQQILSLTAALAGLDLVTITGSALTQQSVAPTLVWLRENEPDVWKQTVKIVGSYDWILIALGAEPHIEKNWALESGLFDVNLNPVAQVLEEAQLDTSLLPTIRSSGDIVGGLDASAAERCGLPAGTALVVGGADHVLSAFAAGVENEGDWLVKLGGAGDILVASDKIVVDSRIYLDAHPVPGRWLPNGCMATSGSLIRWYQALVGGEDLMQLDREASEREPASVLCLPYFLGEKSPLHDTNLRGTFAGLHLGHDRADLYRSVLEAIAFGFRHHTDVFREIGLKLDRVMITNGGSKSSLWKQIHSEVLGTEMYPVVDHPGASLGAALVAAVGVGRIRDWAAARRFITLGSPVIPNPSNSNIYSQAYAEWLQLGSAVAPISHSIVRRTRS